MISAGDGQFCGGVAEEIDWGDLLNVPIPDDLTFSGHAWPEDSAGALLSIEQALMEDDYNINTPSVEEDFTDRFFSDVLLDSPVESSGDKVNCDVPQTRGEGDKDDGDVCRGALVNSPVESFSSGDKVSDDAPQPRREDNEVNDDVDTEQDDNNDPLAKKRKRQMRNRDAAVRSRERKKIYVKDLEMKSKYFEAECKRLGMWLQFCLAENQSLRLSLYNNKAVDASVTRQESAVLFLESLLLGSLLWSLGVICLFFLILPNQLQSALKAARVDNVDSGSKGILDPREGRRSKTFRKSVNVPSSMMGKRFKASRSRMKLVHRFKPVACRVLRGVPLRASVFVNHLEALSDDGREGAWMATSSG